MCLFLIKKLRVGGTIMAPEQFVVPHYVHYYIPVCSSGSWHSVDTNNVQLCGILMKIRVIMQHKVMAAKNVKILRAVCTKRYIFACLLHLYD